MNHKLKENRNRHFNGKHSKVLRQFISFTIPVAICLRQELEPDHFEFNCIELDNMDTCSQILMTIEYIKYRTHVCT